MTNNIQNKSRGLLRAESFEITVVKDSKLKPFLNTFHATGRNIKQQQLGKIFGIIQVDDTSESSAYLPNLLTQIIKKAYFKSKNQHCGKSFELALHKTNLALTELTQHEIVKWLNNLNAAIGVVCGNEIHFTQIGKGRILFLKNGKISVIDQDPNQTEDYHPMKTFSTISAGKLKEGHKLIFTLQETLATLKKEEIERHFKTFTPDEFDNIISSTLRNEASNTGMVVINIKEQTENDLETKLASPVEKEEDLNFFGKDRKKKKTRKKARNLKNGKEGKITKKSISSATVDPNKSPFENEPEIYVKETDPEVPPTEHQSSKQLEKIKKIYKCFSKKIVLFEKDKISFRNIFFQKSVPCCKKIFKKAAHSTKKATRFISKEKVTQVKNRLQTLIKKIDFSKFKKINFKYSEKLDSFKKQLRSLFKKTATQNVLDKIEIETSIESEKVSATNSVHRFFKKIKRLYLKIKGRLTLLLKKDSLKKIMIVIFVSLVLFALVSILIEDPKINQPRIINQNQAIPSEEKSTELESLKILLSLNKEIKDSTLFKNDLFLLTKDESLIKFSIRDNTKTEILLPEELKKPAYLSSMESLQLVFIISQDQVYSYSPITNSFSENIIVVPDNFKGIGTGTYLTYLYLLDQNSNQLYRYHRAPGGFGASKKWLKETVDLKNATDVDISDSIYIAFDDSKIQRYFQGKKEKEFNLGEDFTPVKIRTKINRDEIFALDKKQGKILKLSENDNLLVSFQDPQFKDANNLSVDFENKKVFVITKKNEILTFDYQ